MKTFSIFWFRRDIRLEDNIGLSHATKSKYPVIPIFIFDEKTIRSRNVADYQRVIKLF